MFVLLVVGTGASIATRPAGGQLIRLPVLPHLLSLSLLPSIGGGIGEGSCLLSLAYSAILGQTPDVYVAQLAPAAVVG